MLTRAYGRSFIPSVAAIWLRTLAGRTSCEEDGKQMVGFAVSFEIGNPAEGKMYFSRSAANRMSAF
jgi:hypothetical protein